MASVDPDHWNPDRRPTSSPAFPTSETGSRRYALASEYLGAIKQGLEDKALRLNRKGRLWPSDLMDWLRTHPAIAPSPGLKAVADHLSLTPRGPGRRRGDGSFSTVDAVLVQQGIAMVDSGEVPSANAAAKVLAPKAHNAKYALRESVEKRLAKAIRQERMRRDG
jgi:hypothetical protein